MADRSVIEWLYDPYLDRAGATWNRWWGCTRESPACQNCYIFRQPPLRMRHMKFSKAGIGGETPIIMAERRVLFAPLRWRDPRMVFVNSLADLWHGKVNVRHVAEMYAIMLLSPRHIYLTLTKRTRRMRNWLRSARFAGMVAEAVERLITEYPGRIDADDIRAARASVCANFFSAPPLNVWVGTTVEDNACAAERIPLLNETPAALRWLSCEPLTSERDDPLDLDPWLRPWPGYCQTCAAALDPNNALSCNACGMSDFDDGLAEPRRFTRPDWVVFGGESGPAAKATDLDTEPAVGLRPISLDNLSRLTAHAAAAGLGVFVKQLGQPWAAEAGANDRKGGDPREWPAHLRIREYPRQLAERALRHQPGNARALEVVGRG